MAHDSIKTGLKIDFIRFEALKNKNKNQFVIWSLCIYCITLILLIVFFSKSKITAFNWFFVSATSFGLE